MGQSAGTVLRRLSDLLSLLVASLTEPVAADQIVQKQDAARAALANLETIAAEAARERRNRLSDDVDPEPIARTLRRLRNDLILIGRVASESLAPQIGADLKFSLQRLSTSGTKYLRDMGDAFAHRQQPRSDNTFEADIEQTLSEMKSMLSDERLVTLRFSLQQLQSHLDDLRQRAEEFAGRR